MNKDQNFSFHPLKMLALLTPVTQLCESLELWLIWRHFETEVKEAL